jgi:PKHD-type hydroxylase
MSIYVFYPEDKSSPEVYAYMPKVFSNEECDKIIELGESLVLKKSTVAAVSDFKVTEEIRKSENSWVMFNEDTKWIYDRLADTSKNMNRQFWNFNLSGFYDNLQFTKYTEGYFYDWHKDYGNTPFPRKLSLVVQLSDPNNYKGGNLEFFQQDKLKPLPTERGDIIFFPSTEYHRVVPVTDGLRYSLVTWIS